MMEIEEPKKATRGFEVFNARNIKPQANWALQGMTYPRGFKPNSQNWEQPRAPPLEMCGYCPRTLFLKYDGSDSFLVYG